jgi:hypothetical protein
MMRPGDQLGWTESSGAPRVICRFAPETRFTAQSSPKPPRR